jgi:hypothetical protein
VLRNQTLQKKGWSWCCSDFSAARRRGVEERDKRERQRDARDTRGTRRGYYGESGQQRGLYRQVGVSLTSATDQLSKSSMFVVDAKLTATGLYNPLHCD